MTPSELTGRETGHLIQHGSHWLHRDVIDDFLLLSQAAQEAGFTLDIASSFRDYDRQSQIWNAKFDGERPILNDDGLTLNPDSLSDREKVHAILRWSALPGASRHHWGTDIDIFASNLLPADTSLQLEPWEYDDGYQRPFSHWLDNHLPDFGFFRPYAADKGGVAREPWHISHVKTSEPLLSQLTKTVLHDVVAKSQISGKDTVLLELDSIYCRYISNICGH